MCGMFVAKYPDWISVVTFRDGSSAFFDGPKDMFKYILHLQRYAPARKRLDLQRIIVMDYYTIKPLNAQNAFHVAGSDVYGPMGSELIPLASEAEAREFLQHHKGTRIIKFSDVTPALIEALDGGSK